MDLRIPESQRPAFASLLTYSEERLALLASTLKSLKPTMFIAHSAREVSEAVGVDEKEAARVLLMVSSLYTLGERPSISKEGLVDTIVAALRNDSELDVTPEQEKRVERFLSNVLHLENSLGVTSKAWYVVRDFERTYCQSRVLTDLRPVFTPGGTELAAFAVTHSLKVTYHEGDQLKEFYVQLLSDDVKDLSKVLARAVEKEESLERVATTTGVSLLREDSDDELLADKDA